MASLVTSSGTSEVRLEWRVISNGITSAITRVEGSRDIQAIGSHITIIYIYNLHYKQGNYKGNNKGRIDPSAIRQSYAHGESGIRAVWCVGYDLIRC